MELAPIHRWSGAILVATYLLTILIRWAVRRGGLLRHIGPAIYGAAGSLLIVECSYLLWYGWTLGSLKDLPGLEIYACAGAVVLITVGLAGIIRGFEEK